MKCGPYLNIPNPVRIRSVCVPYDIGIKLLALGSSLFAGALMSGAVVETGWDGVSPHLNVANPVGVGSVCVPYDIRIQFLVLCTLHCIQHGESAQTILGKKKER